MSKTRTSNGKKGGLLEGKPHYDKDGDSLGGIKAVVTDAGGKPVELEGGEVIINKEASKKYWKELSKINQSAGNGVPILPPDGAVTDEDPEEFSDGGNIIEFNPNHLPNKWITEYAKQIKRDHPEIWKKGGNIFGNEAFVNLCRVRERGHWLDSEEWMYIKWRSYVARHKKDFRIEGVVAMLKWCDKVEKGWGYMKTLIEKEIANLEKKKKPSAFRQAIKEKSLFKDGGKVSKTKDSCQVLDKDGNPAIDDKSLRKMEKCILKLTQTKDMNLNANGKYKLARRKLHKKIIDEFKKNAVCITEGQPIAILMGGSPASGKSSFLKRYRPFLLQEEILKVDADEIRAKLPEYKGYNATQTHQETKDIVTTLISDRNIGVPCDFDLIYDGTMNNVRSYKPLIELLRSRNYKIFIVYMDKVPKEVIMQRMKERYLKTGRFVPAEVVDDFFQKGTSAFEELKPLVDGYLVIDGSNQDYNIIEKGGMQLPEDRAYSKLGQKISAEELEKIEYKRGGNLDKIDSVELDIPLLIRVLEFAREDIKSDPELHHVVERLIEIRDKGVLTMEDYDFIADLKKKEKFSEIERKYANGGTVLLAPNGKPSNLTTEQHKLVRTPEFKAWFGDWENDPENASKVVDENGEPKVVWRGESKEFNKFDYKKLGSQLKTAWRKAGFYFSPTKVGAEQYMIFMRSDILKQFFLNIKNPNTLDSNEFYGVMDWGSLPKQRFKTNKSATDHANSQVEKMKIDNYDGFFVTDLETEDVYEIVAFNPNQIKLADGTNTTFDPNNDDIRFKEGGGIAGTYSRFRPTQTTIFNPPLVGVNGNKLISYTWKYTWTVDFNKNKGEEKEKRISDWSQAEQSAETGRDLVHTYTVEKPTGEVITVSSESVPVILGFTNKEQKKVFGNLATASKTLAKQEMQLAILEAQEQEFLNAQKELENQNKPEVSFAKIEDLPFIWKKYYEENPSKKVDKIYFKMGDILQEQYLPYGKEIDISDWEFPEKLNIKPTTNTINNLEESWVSKRLAEKGLKRPYGIIDLKNRINRQKKKVENMLATQKFEKGGLIAPNGKPSNLTPKQHKLVRTPEFKAWFGDWEKDPENSSKVVDENGEPMVVYHGSNKDFNKFSLEYTATNTGNSGFLGRGFYFATNKTDAKNYGEIVKPFFLKSLKKLDLRNMEYKELAFLLPNLKMKNGKTWKEAFIEIDNIKSQIKSIEIEDLKNGFFNVHYEYKGNWGMIARRNIHEIEADKGLGTIIYRLIEEDPDNIGAIGNYFNPITLSQEIKTQGFDSVMSDGTNMFDLGEEIVAFEPNQIKLADGTNTTFDGNNPDIRFEDGGEIKIDEIIFKVKIYLEEHSYDRETDTETPMWFCRVIKMNENDVDGILTEDNDLEGLNIGNFDSRKKARDFLLRYSEKLNVILLDDNGIGYKFFNSNNADIRFEKGGEVDLIYGEIYSGNQVRNIVSKYSSQEGTDMQEFAVENIKPKDKYVLDFVNVRFLIENDTNLHSFISEEYEPNNKVYYQEIKNPILLGYDKWDNTPNVVLDGYHRVLQALYNKQDQILAFINFKTSEKIRYFKTGGSISKTPAPSKERIYGSEKNKPRSSKDSSSAETIKFDEKTLTSIENKVEEHNEAHPDKKVNLATAKAVVRRGMGAYSKSHRPTISGGKPNSRVAWGLARLNAFLYKAVHGVSKSGKYSQDNDLLDELGIAHKKFADGGTTEGGEVQLNSYREFNEYADKLPKFGYHGTQSATLINPRPSKEGRYGEGFYLTLDPNTAEYFGKFTKTSQGYSQENQSANVFEFDLQGLNLKYYRKAEDMPYIDFDGLRQKNYDGIYLYNEGEIVIFNIHKLPSGKLVRTLNGTKVDGNNPNIRFKNGGEIPKKKKNGNCYEKAGKMILYANTKYYPKIDFIGKPYLVHAQVTGQGAIEGVKYGHAWIEDDAFVYDYSNKRELKVPKALYYQIGQIIEQQPIHFKYTFEEARRKMNEIGHYGSWDLITESEL